MRQPFSQIRLRAARKATVRSDSGATLQSKLTCPALPSHCVERPEQLALLKKALNFSLTVLSASAGSGKTTLLSQWYRQQAFTSPVAWLTIDQYDNEPSRLFTHLRATLIAAGIPMPSQHIDVTNFVSSLANATGSLGASNLVVILDDAHTLLQRQAIEQLRFVLEHSPDCVHWVIAGRGIPDVNVSAFALRDQLFRIDSQLDGDAHFVSALANQLACATLTTDDAARICVATGGWLAGIKLSLTKQQDYPHDNTHAYFSGVLNAQPSHVRRFLLTCSVVDPINAQLANALLAQDHAEAMLDASASAQLFLRRVESGSYRFNPLFLNYLRLAAQRDIADQLGELHLKASRWYAAQQQYDDALHHAFQCTDREWRLDLLALATRCYLKRGAIEAALAWSERLTHSDLFAREALWTTHATALILARRYLAAQALLQQATALNSTQALVGQAITPKLQTLQLMLSLLSTRASDDAADCPLDSADTYLTGTLMSLQAYSLFNQQKFDAAGRRALQARDLLLTQGSQYGATHANAILCAALGYVGQYDAALNHCERIFALLQTGPRNTAWANAATALAQVRYEQNRMTEAQLLTLEALPKLASVSSVQAFAAATIVLARTYAAQSAFPQAWRALDDLHGYLETGCSKQLLAQVCYEKIRLCLLNERLVEAEAVAVEFALDSLEAQHAWNAEGSGEIFIDPALARLGCAQALRLLKAGHHHRCQTILQTLITDATGTGFVHRRIALLALQAVCFNDMQHTQATSALAQGLALTLDHGFMRSVFDEAPGLNHLLISIDVSGPVLAAKHFARYPDLFAAKDNNASASRVRKRRVTISPQEALTDRETTVLRLLSQGLSNQEICVRSNIALTTTKWHLKNIFAKLDVGTRTAALARARALQLID